LRFQLLGLNFRQGKRGSRSGLQKTAFGAVFALMAGAAPLQILHSFQATFVCMGLITLASAAIFWQLSPAVRVVKKAESTEASGQG
jgi:hypothetical protein